MKSSSTANHFSPRVPTLLQLKSYCVAEKGEKVDVVVQISTNEGERSTALLYRYVLVIDVSSGMRTTKYRRRLSLLDRVKIFAESFVEALGEKSWLSMVKFSEEAKICLKMTRMNKTGQKMAKEAVAMLEPESGSNIAEGLVHALRTTNLKLTASSSITRVGGKHQYRDCIILFTNGDSNNETKTADEVVSLYKQLHRDLDRTSRVPISAFTFGNDQPVLLREISSRLGCEAFYWLNEKCDFEAELFTPMSLREKVFVSDVSVQFSCLEGVTFSTSEISQQFLEEKQLADPSRELSYFIHNIPAKMNKHISLALSLPKNAQLNKKGILKIKVSYLDFLLRKHEKTDILELDLTTMHDISTHHKKESGKKSTELLKRTSAYIFANNEIDHSWRDVEEAFAKVCQEKCRKVAMQTLRNSGDILRGIDPDCIAVASEINEGITKIEEIKKTLSTALGNEKGFSKKIGKAIEETKARIAFGKTAAKNKNWCQLAAMESALAAESPTSVGVFDLNKPQPYMTSHTARKQEQYRKEVKDKLKKKEEPAAKVFKALYIALSERLTNQYTGRRRETFEEFIIRLGGTTVPHVGTFGTNTVLICSIKDFKRKTIKVRDALNGKVPLVMKRFLDDCLEQGRIVEMDHYIMKI